MATVAAILLAFLVAIAIAILLGAGALAVFSWRTMRRVETALPPLGRFAAIGDRPLHYLERGAADRPAILLIHGLGGQVRNFPAPLLDALARRFRVIAVDRPGSGHSTRSLRAPAGLAAQAGTVALLIRHLGLHRPLVVGHSLGGALALTVALDHPDLVGGLALLAPLTHGQDTVPPQFRFLAIRSLALRILLGWTLAVPAASYGGPAALREVFGPDPVPPDHGTTGGGLLGLRPHAYVHASSDLVAVATELPRLVARYPTLALPVGILFGTADRILDPELHGSRGAAAIPGATLEWVEGAGHMLPVIHPDRTAAFIERVADRIAAPAERTLS